MHPLLHVADPATYRMTNDVYAPSSLESVGFVHCCRPLQLSGVLERWFGSSEALLLLTLDEGAFADSIRDEAGPGGQFFPHIYGSIPKSSVLSVTPLARDRQRNWQLPTFLPGRPLPDSSQLARLFHETYTDLSTQERTQSEWIADRSKSILDALPPTFEDLPEREQRLLVQVMDRVLHEITGWG